MGECGPACALTKAVAMRSRMVAAALKGAVLACLSPPKRCQLSGQDAQIEKSLLAHPTAPPEERTFPTTAMSQ